MRKGLKGVIVLHPFNNYFHCMQYLLRGWSMMTPFTPLFIVTSLYDVCIERMEYDDTFHTSYSIPSKNTSASEVTTTRGMEDIIVLRPVNRYFLQ
jgi:hypothetical protein